MTAPRSKRIALRVDDDEHATLTLAAKRQDQSVPEFARTAALEQATTWNGLAGGAHGAHRTIAKHATLGLPEPRGVAVDPDGHVLAWLDTEALFEWQVHLTGAKVIRPTADEARELTREGHTPLFFEVVGDLDGRQWKLRNAPIAPPRSDPALDAVVVADATTDLAGFVDELTDVQTLDVQRILARSKDRLRTLAANGYRIMYDPVLAADATGEFAAVAASNGHAG